MDRPLKEHIQSLEEQVQTLTQQMMEKTGSIDERNRIEVNIRAAQLALEYYRRAFELERKIVPS